MSSELLDVHVYISTSVGDANMVSQVYQSCLVSIHGYNSTVDRLLLDMIVFKVILSMDYQLCDFGYYRRA